MRAWRTYAVWSAAVLLLLAVVVGLALPARATGWIWTSAAVAYGVQLAAFGALVAVRRRPERFVAGWVGGIALRIATVAALALWVVRGPSAAAALLSLVGFLFVLMLMEPVFLRIAE